MRIAILRRWMGRNIARHWIQVLPSMQTDSETSRGFWKAYLIKLEMRNESASGAQLKWEKLESQMKNEFWVVPQMRMNLCLCLENRLEDMGPGSIFDRKLVKLCFWCFFWTAGGLDIDNQALEATIYLILNLEMKMNSASGTLNEILGISIKMRFWVWPSSF